MRCFILSRLTYAVVKVLLNISEILANYSEPSVLSTSSQLIESWNDKKLGSASKLKF
ncbi:hypothetical protein PMIT1323_00025 [Prochlorococcus marinus str. MIT 1323]|nr:hypothetical protein PMIT1323_00025 [Prochlorococcus marinus str. MIT 1323]